MNKIPHLSNTQPKVLAFRLGANDPVLAFPPYKAFV